MPTIQVTDKLGVSFSIDPPPLSVFAEWVKQAPAIVAHELDLAQASGVTLRDPAVRQFSTGLTFAQPIDVGRDDIELQIGGDASASFEVIARDPDAPELLAAGEFGEAVPIPENTCYCALTLSAQVSASLSGGTGAVTAGFDGSCGIEIANYRRFRTDDTAPTLIGALRETIGGFSLPLHVDDLDRIPAGGVVTMTGSANLAFSATANLLAIANPLLTASLPAGLPEISVRQSASVEVGARYEIRGEHQVRVYREEDRGVLLGWYRKRGSELAVSVTANAGISAEAGGHDVLPRVLKALSSDAAAGTAEGLSEDEQEAIASAVQKAVDRKLAISLSAELSSTAEHDATFLYRIDTAALDARGREAVTRALRGDISDLTGGTLPNGITEMRSVFGRIRERSVRLHVNLLGIYNFGSIHKLVSNGTVTYTPSSGELVIADRTSSEDIRSSTVNFGADESKLRRLMFGSLMITAVYRGSLEQMGGPVIDATHTYFFERAKADRDDIRRGLRALAALGRDGDPDAVLPAGKGDYGRMMLFARTTYDNATARTLFVSAEGEPRAVDEYENVGRRALASLILPDAIDSFRLKPLRNDALWKQMKQNGPPGHFGGLFPREIENSACRTDYLTIRWWADSMAAMAQTLARVRRWFAANPGARADAEDFRDLREELAKCVKDVVDKLPADEWLFPVGEPWALVTLYLASDGKAGAEGRLISPRLALEVVRATSRAAVV